MPAFNRIPVRGLFLALLLSLPALAEEGGSGHYMPGGFASLFDFPGSEPGSATAFQFNYYDAGAGAGRALPLGGQVRVDLDVQAFAALWVMSQTVSQKVLGGVYTCVLAAPYVHLEVSAEAAVGSTAQRETDTTDDFGDMIIIPLMLEWRCGLVQYGVMLPIYAPTGGYDPTLLANAGKNYWTFEPTFAVHRLDPKTLVSASAFASIDLSTENGDTHYQSGPVFHLDATLSKFVARPDGSMVGFGVNGFYYRQFSGDSGSGATLGGFLGHTYGIGPVLSWMKKTKESTTFAELKWLPELDVSRRVKGDIFWLKIGASW